MKLIKGNKLNADQKRQVLAAYIHRWTVENPNPCIIKRRQGMTIPLLTDEQWLAEHAFYFTKSGRLALNRRHCEPAFMAD